MSSLYNARSFLEKVSAAEAERRPEDRLMDALARLIDIPLPHVTSILGVTPAQAQRAVEALRADGKIVVVEDADGRRSVRRALPA